MRLWQTGADRKWMSDVAENAKKQERKLRYTRASWVAVLMAAAGLLAFGATLYYNPITWSQDPTYYGPDHNSY